MAALSDFLITQKWPAKNPDVIQLYSLGTPNGVKATIALEEMELPYELHTISFANEDQLTPEFLSLNPNNKIPAMIDPNGPNGEPLPLWESGAMLIYLADKSGVGLPDDGTKRAIALQWLMFQMGGIGPMFGQFGFFHKFAGKDIDDPRPVERYAGESKRLLSVLNVHLEDKKFAIGDEFTIADIALGPWIRSMRDFYQGGERVDWDAHTNVHRYLDDFLARPSVQRGIEAFG